MAAGDASADAPRRSSAIYFANGVLTTPVEAEVSSKALELALRDALADTETSLVSLAIAYNSTAGTRDLFEAMAQDFATDYTSMFRWLGGLAIMPAFFQEAVKQIAIKIDEHATLYIQDLATHVESYQEQMASGAHVICVPHSQGNFFVNQSFGLLAIRSDDNFDVVSVATPDSTVANGGQYTTLKEDRIILALRVWKSLVHLPGPLPPNLTNVGAASGGLQHGFAEVYMAQGSNSREKIVMELVDHVRR